MVAFVRAAYPPATVVGIAMVLGPVDVRDQSHHDHWAFFRFLFPWFGLE